LGGAANPDLVERFAGGHPLAESDPATIYGGHTEGYTDYPTIAEADPLLRRSVAVIRDRSAALGDCSTG
jgi:hypothetical protein